jgi:hypothetical protein
MKTLIVTPTILSRFNDPFLKPCVEARTQIAKTESDEFYVDTDQGPLALRYELARQAAIKWKCTHMMIVEDDELVPSSILTEFHRTLLETRGKAVCCVKPLRPFTAHGNVYMPLLWNYEHNYPVINDRIMTVTQLKPDPNDHAPFKVQGGTITSPLLMDLTLNIPFRSKQGYISDWGPHDDQWDLNLADDMATQRIPFYVRRDLTVKHFCIETYNIYE